MLIIKERESSSRNLYYKVFYICPVCNTEYPIVNAVYFCPGCYKSIVDIKAVLDDETYALKYHFGTIKESGNNAGMCP